MIRFFPLPSDIIPSLIVPLTTPPSTASNSSPSSAPPTHLLLPSSMPALTVPLTPVSASTNMAYTQHDLQAHLLLRVLDILDHEISRLISTVASLEMRFIGSSVLVVYEGDESRLASALERYDIWSQLDSRFMVAASYPDDEDDDDEDEELNSLESSTSSEDDEDDGTRADARLARRCPPLSLRMIDFAHTRLVEGEGPDEGVLKGLRTLESLVRNRKVGVRAYLAGQESEDGVTSLYEPSTRPGDGQGRQTMLA
jgi:1D-myo-inositol-tetrakisphosphate 5-kinase/inositol-polyphosphate multikinase